MNYADYEAAQRKNERRRELADAMLQQGLSGGPGGQMVSGRYVAPSGFAALAPALQGLLGAAASRRTDAESDALESERGADITRAIEEYSKADPATKKAKFGALISATSKPSDAARLMIASELQRGQNGEPLESVIGPDGKPVLVTRSQAAGMTPWSKDSGEDPPVAVVGPDGKPKYVKRSESFGMTPWDKPSASTTVNVNSAKSLYETLGDKQAAAYADLYSQAQASPERVDRAARVRELLDRTPITGTGAEQMLAISKGLKQVGFDVSGDSIADTELLGRELAGSTLEAIKSSGLGAGSGFSNADRDFLEKVTGGSIAMDAKTLRRIAELNDRSARATIKRWNDTAARLDQAQLKTLGMTPIEMPSEMTRTTSYPNGVPDLANDPRYSKYFQGGP